MNPNPAYPPRTAAKRSHIGVTPCKLIEAHGETKTASDDACAQGSMFTLPH